METTATLTPAQTAIKKHFDQILTDIKKPLNCVDEGILEEGLRMIGPDTIWGYSLQKALIDGCTIAEVLPGLVAQCMDDPFTMSCVLSKDLMILVLRSAN